MCTLAVEKHPDNFILLNILCLMYGAVFFYLKCFCFFSFKTCHLKVYHFPYMVENEGRNIFKQWDYYIWRKQAFVWFCTYSMCTVYHARHMKSAIMYIINMYFCCANKHIAFLHSTVMGQLLAHTGPDKDLRDSVVFGWLCLVFCFFSLAIFFIFIHIGFFITFSVIN